MVKNLGNYSKRRIKAVRISKPNLSGAGISEVLLEHQHAVHLCHMDRSLFTKETAKVAVKEEIFH